MQRPPVLAAVILATTFVFPFAGARAQSSGAPDSLFQQVQALDTKLFAAYNHCDLATLSSMVSDDLEFYHDKTGLAVGRQVFIEAIKNTSAARCSENSFPER